MSRQMNEADKGAALSIVAYLFLAALKLTVGIWTGSDALRADGLNNTTDIAASLAVLIGLRISRKPPDSDHRYGHNRAETIAALTASLIMIAVGVQVMVDAIGKLRTPSVESPDLIAAWTALFGAAVIYAVYRYNLRLSRRLNSSALRAAAQDNRSDALVSTGAFVGIIGSRFGLPWLDPLTAVIVALLICKTAWEIFRDTSHNLTDGFDESELSRIRATIQETPGVISVKDLKARNLGNNTLVDVTLEVARELTVGESHEITEVVEKRLLDAHMIEYVQTHLEPDE
ncbi:cation diffusion facilitator family transporter [Gorillibacterium timonense]|uniref:cation diffusion facilitator family transporter n=1 Tax=Gorillibacterium timonense TaxID=1689269 RepID=UPI00071D276A|nr:cation diffusion facilitator family transporter [Gorillibacterium timonense]